MENDGKVRLLRLLELLQTESDEQHPLTITYITEEMKKRWDLEAYRITIQKDVAALQAVGYRRSKTITRSTLTAKISATQSEPSISPGQNV